MPCESGQGRDSSSLAFLEGIQTGTAFQLSDLAVYLKNAYCLHNFWFGNSTHKEINLTKAPKMYVQACSPEALWIMEEIGNYLNFPTMELITIAHDDKGSPYNGRSHGGRY
jgi:hypothetical protein